MEYIENPKCEELKKQGKIREAAEQLKKEIQLNLIRVHNLYSDNKFREDELFEATSSDYARNKDRELIYKIKEYWRIAGVISGIDGMYTEMDADKEKYNEEEKYKEYLKEKKKLVKLYKKELKNIN
ncbi:MAG: hypothetical protein ACI4ON_04445 [Clostridia bacterium]